MRNLLGVLILLSAVTCAQDAPKAAPFATVRVTPQGKILLNDRPSALDQLDLNFAQLAREHGIVWYYAENPQSPSALAQRVKRKINDYHLAIRSCKDYEDHDCKEAIP
ncbi:MAG: hypothetical protein H0X25_07845 [Acidobacteriales bacterium]|nr:hypothetical protein [Terriglobales bacterium]